MHENRSGLNHTYLGLNLSPTAKLLSDFGKWLYFSELSSLSENLGRAIYVGR